MESRWRQLDKFETSVKAIAEAKSTWRKKMSVREGEIEALKVCRLTNSIATLSLTMTRAVVKLRTAVATDEPWSHVRWRISDGNTFAYGPSYERRTTVDQSSESTGCFRGEDDVDESENAGGRQQMGGTS